MSAAKNQVLMTSASTTMAEMSDEAPTVISEQQGASATTSATVVEEPVEPVPLSVRSEDDVEFLHLPINVL